MLATPRYTPQNGEELCKFVEQQIPIITEEGDFLDVLVAHVYLSYCYSTQQVVIDLDGYHHTDESGRAVFYPNTGIPAVPERPYGMRWIEKILTKRIFNQKERDRLLADDDSFQSVRDKLPIY